MPLARPTRGATMPPARPTRGATCAGCNPMQRHRFTLGARSSRSRHGQWRRHDLPSMARCAPLNAGRSGGPTSGQPGRWAFGSVRPEVPYAIGCSRSVQPVRWRWMERTIRTLGVQAAPPRAAPRPRSSAVRPADSWVAGRSACPVRGAIPIGCSRSVQPVRWRWMERTIRTLGVQAAPSPATRPRRSSGFAGSRGRHAGRAPGRRPGRRAARAANLGSRSRPRPLSAVPDP